MKKLSLTQGKNALIDNNMYALVKSLKWFAVKWSNVWYAGRCFRHGEKNFMLHHVVAGFPITGLTVDHINGNGLDNRRKNLRLVTRSENFHNSWKHRLGKIPGVTYCKGKWQAYVLDKDKKRHLGVFSTQLAAAKAVQNG